MLAKYTNHPRATNTVTLTVLALFAFAANSVLCRYALLDDAIDPASFTGLRLISGAVVLAFMIQFYHSDSSQKNQSKGSWSAAIMLFVYASAFSYAYTLLGAAMGALILFGVVQLSMVSFSIWSGHKLHLTEWVGIIIATLGLFYLLLPGLTAPPITGFILMSLSGIAWAMYSLRGRGSSQAILDTAYNFIRTVPLVLVLLLVSFDDLHSNLQGLILAIASGAITSGIGYIIWYRALRDLTSTQAGVVQLLVPVITAVGGVFLLSEELSFRLILSAIFILGGIALVTTGQKLWFNFKQT